MRDLTASDISIEPLRLTMRKSNLDFAEKGLGVLDVGLGVFLLANPHSMQTQHSVYRLLISAEPYWVWGIVLILIGGIRFGSSFLEDEKLLKLAGPALALMFWCAFATAIYQNSGRTIGVAHYSSTGILALVIYLWRQDVRRRIKALTVADGP